MKQYFGLLNTVAQEYNIPKGIQEPEIAWKARVIYSLLGQTGYSSLWDIQEDLQPASIVHFKNRIEDVLKSLLCMYPEMSSIFSGEHSKLSTEIYNLMSHTGYIYHKPNRIVAAIRKETIGTACVFLRGQAISEKRWLSGIGGYLPIAKTEAATSESVFRMFRLQEESLTSVWKNITSGLKWEKSTEELKLQYLRIAPPFKYGYWTDSPDLSGAISLARVGFAENYMYFLYMTEGRSQLLSQLPNWMMEGHGSRVVSNACLANRGTLPPTTYHIDGSIVSLYLGYLLPPAELNLIKLYSWPTTYIDLPHDFRRVMSLAVFEDLKEVLETIGYQFKED